MTKSEKKQAKRGKKKLMLVRYGHMGLLGWFEHQENDIPKLQTRVVVKTDRGLELGSVVGPLCYRSGQFRFTVEQVEEYMHKSGDEQTPMQKGRFVRYATAEDTNEERHLEKSAKEELEYCKRFVGELELQMEVVASEHLFGGERIIFYFVAEGRIDFRELVKRLAREFQTRIEMRQIGSRDEAKLAVDYEACGLECCCKRFLNTLKPVNMRMAKIQKATLDPSKISGHCGRLKCCLRYEDQTYRELKARLPKKNARVKTIFGEGTVVDTHILTQLIVVQRDDGPQVVLPLEEIEVLNSEPTDSEDKKTAQDKQEEDKETDELTDQENNKQGHPTNGLQNSSRQRPSPQSDKPEEQSSQKEHNDA
jgi:cell fate regulator YaaT (PSP1 superfamily)